MSLAEREAAYGPIIVAAMRINGVPPEWGLAIARVESVFEPGARNGEGGDGRRGGAWGIFQMTLKTARDEGYQGTGEGLLDATVCADVAGRLLSRLQTAHRVLEDVASCYNSGKPVMRAPKSTRTKYVPLVVRLAREYVKRWDLIT